MQEVIVSIGVVVGARNNIGAIQNRRHLVSFGPVVLIPDHHQKGLVSHGPLRVCADVDAEPLICLSDRAVMHVVVQIRDDEGNVRKLRKVVRGKGAHIALD